MSKTLGYTLDYTVGAFIVYQGKVLLVHHQKLNCWICPGGHVEPNEDPIAALHREILEETGIVISIAAPQPVLLSPAPGDQTKMLIPPHFMDVHSIASDHKHVGMFWICNIAGAVGSPGSEDILARLHTCDEHLDTGFFDFHELETLPMWPAIRQYARIALASGGNRICPQT